MKKIIGLSQGSDWLLSKALDQVMAHICLKSRKSGCSSYVLCDCNPDAGATALAASLAVSFAESGKRTLLVDADLQKRSRPRQPDEEQTPGLFNYLDGTCGPDEIVQETDHASLRYISAGGRPGVSPARALNSGRFDELLQALLPQYDYIVFDAPAVTESVDGSLIAARTDGMILVTSQGRFSKTGLRETVGELRRTGITVTGVILNQVSKSEFRRSMRDYGYNRKELRKNRTDKKAQ